VCLGRSPIAHVALLDAYGRRNALPRIDGAFRAKSRARRGRKVRPTLRWREMDSKRRSLAEFRRLRSGLKAISKHFSYRTFARLERAAISDGIERGCRGRETANLRFPGFQPFGAPSAKLARATQPTKLPHFLAKTRRVGSVFPDPVESFLDGRI